MVFFSTKAESSLNKPVLLANANSAALVRVAADVGSPHGEVRSNITLNNTVLSGGHLLLQYSDVVVASERVSRADVTPLPAPGATYIFDVSAAIAVPDDRAYDVGRALLTKLNNGELAELVREVARQRLQTDLRLFEYAFTDHVDLEFSDGRVDKLVVPTPDGSLSPWMIVLVSVASALAVYVAGFMCVTYALHVRRRRRGDEDIVEEIEEGTRVESL